MKPDCPCFQFHTPQSISNPVEPEPGRTREEFSDDFSYLEIPWPGIMAYYRHSEKRILWCQKCEQTFFYESQTQSGIITETLKPLSREGLSSELERLEKWGVQVTEQYPEFFKGKLEKLLADCAALRSTN